MSVLLFLLPVLALAVLSPSDTIGLTALQNSIQPVPSNWIGSVSTSCENGWSGIVCDPSNTTILQIGIRTGAQGSIPTEIAALQNLTLLNLIGNALTGTLPSQIGMLDRLKILMISFNSIGGSVPAELNNLRALEVFNCQRNAFSAALPLLNITSLKMLSLAYNSFGGSIPPLYANLTQLTFLDLSYNLIDGQIPTVLTQMSKLQNLNIANNVISGAIPQSIGAMAQLTNFQASFNLLSGSIPSTFGTLFLLKTIRLDNNLLTGTLPTQLSQAQRVTTLNLANNSLSGTLPPAVFSRLTNYIGFVNLHNNFFSGTIPALPKVLNFDGSMNYFSGVFPSTLGFVPRWIVDFNRSCCCSSSCVICSANVCPNSIGGGTVIVGGSVNTSTVSYSNNTILTGSTITTTTYTQTSNVTLVGSSLNVTGILTVGEGTLTLGLSNVTSTNMIITTGSTLVIDNSTVNASVLVGNGAIQFSEGTINVGCFYTGPEAELVLDLSARIEQMLRDFGTVNLDIIQSNISCISGTFHNVSLKSASCVTVSIESTPSKVTAVLVPCAPPKSLIGAVIGGFAAFLLLLAASLTLYWTKSKSLTSSLPDSVTWQWNQYFWNPFGWKSKGKGATKVHYKKLEPDTPEWNKMLKMKNLALSGNDIQISGAYALFNPGLVQNFVNARAIKKNRFTNAPNLFLKKTWEIEPSDADQTKHLIKHKVSVAISNANEKSLNKFQQTGDLTDLSDFSLDDIKGGLSSDAPTKHWVFERFQQRIERCDWNEGEVVPILAAAHGTDEATGWKIAQTGFANLSLLDSGYYGKGIYFTTYALYCFPYFATKRPPVLVLSYVMPGNVYPVNEHHQSYNSKMGHAIESGYDAHYAVTTSNGAVPAAMDAPENNLYDELVVGSETSITPIYLLEIDDSNFGDLQQKFYSKPGQSKVGERSRETPKKKKRESAKLQVVIEKGKHNEKGGLKENKKGSKKNYDSISVSSATTLSESTP